MSITNRKKWKKSDDGRLLISDLVAGTVSVRIECKDCETWKKDGVTVSREICTELEPVALAEKPWRPVDIEVSPVNVEVYLNGKKIATALNSRNVLVTDPLEPGIYRILIFAEGYESWNRKDAEIFNDISTSIGPLKLPKLQGGKIIIEAPEKAEFYLDDQKAVAAIRSDKRTEINNVKTRHPMPLK